MELRNIHGKWGIRYGGGNYMVFREVLFNVGKENEYLKDFVEGYYGTLYQALLGMRRFVINDNMPDCSSMDEAIEKIEKINEDFKIAFDRPLSEIVSNNQNDGNDEDQLDAHESL